MSREACISCGSPAGVDGEPCCKTLAARIATLEAIIIDVARELSSQASNSFDASFWEDVARRVEDART